MDYEDAKGWHDYQHKMEEKCQHPELCPMAVIIKEAERFRKTLEEAVLHLDLPCVGECEILEAIIRGG